MKLSKRIIALLVALMCLFSSFAVNAQEIEGEVEPPTEDYIDVLFLGNSLVYYNSMDTAMFPKMCAAAGKEVRVTSITEAGTTIYRLASEKTTVGKKVLNALSENTYDYVVLEPSRRVTPFEYTVYHAEKEAALKLNKIINDMGAKTLVLAEPGLNTGKVEVYTMKENGIDSASTYSLPIDRNTHSRYVENMCDDLCSQMTNAEVVRIGAATEVLLKNFPDYNSLYQKDNKHPTTRGSYLQAACIYSAIFDESYIGKGYTSSLFDYNALIAQRAAAVAVLGEPEGIMLSNECTRTIDAKLVSNTTTTLTWKEPKQADYYEIYRKIDGGKYELLGRTVSNECEYSDTTLEPDTKYYYKIKAVESVGELSFSLDYSTEDSVKTLAKPEKVKLTLKNRKTAIINITAVSGANYYDIYRLKEGDSSYKLVGSTSKLQYIDDTLKTGNTYIYKITAVKQSGKVVSKMSSGARIVSLASPKISLASTKKGRVSVNITAVKGATGYGIYAKAKGQSSYKLLTKTSKLKYTAKSLTSGKTYYFRVRAYKTKNATNYSSVYRNGKIVVK